jgi:hypothetical protein
MFRENPNMSHKLWKTDNKGSWEMLHLNEPLSHWLDFPASNSQPPKPQPPNMRPIPRTQYSPAPRNHSQKRKRY